MPTVALMHVMNALVAHGALVVDVSDGGTNFEVAKKIAKMWEAATHFFDKINQNASLAQQLPPMKTVMETGSQTAKVGYANYDNGSMQFLETRKNRMNGEILPEEVRSILGEENATAFRDVFDAISEIGKIVVRIAVGASSLEAGAFQDEECDNPEAQAFEAARTMADELLDDGGAFHGSGQFPICMSPHRLCRYTNNPSSTSVSASREVFGAHVDSTWVTVVPVAAVSGLEVYDEEEKKWYRPELAARCHWEKEQEKKKGKDSKSFKETIAENGSSLPWHSRYVVLMPGELLQIATRNEIQAAVHRVVATLACPSRLSAPVLLRCRPGVKMDVSKYLGGTLGNPLLEECDGMTIEEIHAALQPTSFQ